MTLADRLERINRGVGRLVAWLALAMVVMMSINVTMRYLFAAGDPWQQELVRFFHAGLFLLGAGYAYANDAHVRVDVCYHHFRPRVQAWVNLLGVLLLLFPFCGALIWFSWYYVLAAWAIREGSGEFRGMPGVFLLKTGIWGCALLLILQGCAVLLRSGAVIVKPKKKDSLAM